MTTYISPDGNPEVWDEKPDGYFTLEEWAAAHPAPEPDPEEVRPSKVADIKAELAALDLASIRPLRAIDNGADVPEDHEKLLEIEARVVNLRRELLDLEGN